MCPLSSFIGTLHFRHVTSQHRTNDGAADVSEGRVRQALRGRIRDLNPSAVRRRRPAAASHRQRNPNPGRPRRYGAIGVEMLKDEHGVDGVVDLAPHLGFRGVFEPLRAPANFAQFRRQGEYERGG